MLSPRRETPDMNAPLIDDTAICPVCDGSGFGFADMRCNFCGGCGGVSLALAQVIADSRRDDLDDMDDDDLEAWLGDR